jgi:D-alanyl-D-alanine carboxypeptidase (penicillin-binding protein 5/6)
LVSDAKRGAIASLKAEVKYSGPINAPFTAGTELAQMVIDIPGHAPVTVPLVAEADVAKGGFGTHVKTAFGIMARRLLEQVGS